MIPSLAITLISLYMTVVSAVPVIVDRSDNNEDGKLELVEEYQEPSNNLAKTWEIVLVVVFSLVVIGILATVVYVRMRHKRRKQERRTSGSVQSTSDLISNSSAKNATTTTTKTVEDVITPPMPTLPYSGLLNASRKPR
ncbi:hypothetical protein NLI96_g10033 [Meripilus lineatus]|uniref:Uncharacterized protein n=1 Tax=Meripilus lineatus TaxID=2056292 RepID=A0AAD5YCD4_9APHY|nr:hypothetical protein NLI96_g10033 [Physisporinus lineatus]